MCYVWDGGALKPYDGNQWYVCLATLLVLHFDLCSQALWEVWRSNWKVGGQLKLVMVIPVFWNEKCCLSKIMRIFLVWWMTTGTFSVKRLATVASIPIHLFFFYQIICFLQYYQHYYQNYRSQGYLQGVGKRQLQFATIHTNMQHPRYFKITQKAQFLSVLITVITRSINEQCLEVS